MLADPAYHAALASIFAYSETARSPDQIKVGRVRKLDRMRALLGLVGNPQARYPSILIAGTKGKGSMAASLASILTAAGYRVGRYTQPHLYSYRERTWVNGDFITPGEVAKVLEEIEPALELIRRQVSEIGCLTTFDVGTVLSLVSFARAGVDVAVVEVGVGGATDATNVLEPVISLIGPVGLDHRPTLGPDLGSIAREKAGVARSGASLIVGRQEREALEVIEAHACRVGASMRALGRDFRAEASDWSPDSFQFEGGLGEIGGLRTPLQGDFQRDNAVTAVAAAVALTRTGWSIADEAIREGLSSVEWPGRFQTVVANPLTIVDGAHNGSAARALASAIRGCLAGRRVTLVFGMAEDKDARAFVAELAPLVERVVVTRARHARSTDPAEIAPVLGEVGVPYAIVPAPGEALQRAWEELPANGAVLVSGSLFLVGDIMEWLLGAHARVPQVVS